MPDAVSMIFFRSGSPAIGIGDAERLLADGGLHVVRNADTLSVCWDDDGPELSVNWSAEPHVAQEAAEIARSAPSAAGLNGCDARFEIGIEDLDEALDESNTLIEVQGILQDATAGYLFNSWNGEVSGPQEAG